MVAVVVWHRLFTHWVDALEEGDCVAWGSGSEQDGGCQAENKLAFADIADGNGPEYRVALPPVGGWAGRVLRGLGGLVAVPAGAACAFKEARADPDSWPGPSPKDRRPSPPGTGNR